MVTKGNTHNSKLSANYETTSDVWLHNLQNHARSHANYAQSRNMAPDREGISAELAARAMMAYPLAGAASPPSKLGVTRTHSGKAVQQDRSIIVPLALPRIPY